MEVKDRNGLIVKTDSRTRNSFGEFDLNSYFFAFTMAELMVILLIISLALAAFMPIMTKRGAKTASTGELWESIGATKDIHFGTNASTLGAAIGNDDFEGVFARLLLNSDNSGGSTSLNQILFKQNNATTGRLIADGSGNIGLGMVTMPTNGATNTFAIGSDANTEAYVSDAIAIGNNAYANPSTAAETSGISIGHNAMGHAASTVAIGYFTMPYGANSIAIGSGFHDWRTENTSAMGDSGIGIGGGSSSGTASIAIGTKAIASKDYSIAIGNAKAQGAGSVAIGDGAVAADNAVALNATAGVDEAAMPGVLIGPTSISIGYQSGLHGNGVNSIGFGHHAMSPADNTILFGGVLGTDKVYFPGKLSFPTTKSISGSSEACIDGNGILFKNINISSPCQSGSDRKLKNIHGEFTGGLAQIKKLKVYDYTYKSDKKKTPKVGVIAQDLMKVFPEAVTKNDAGYFMIRQEDMFYAMVNAIKQLDVIVQNLTTCFKSLTQKIKKIDLNLANLVKTNQNNTKDIKGIMNKEDDFDIRISKLEKTIKNKAR